MSLNISKGNMYGFVTHTFNMVKGKCSHDCVYCYMKQFKLNPVRFDKSELKTDLGAGNFIFVGSSTDMWARDIPDDWIRQVLTHCMHFPNTYLFQSKNPFRFYKWRDSFPANTIIATTIETNRDTNTNAPEPRERAEAMNIMWTHKFNLKRMVTIEPIMDFDIEPLIKMIQYCIPEWVNIGADSKGHNLPEPSKEKVNQLIIELKKFTKIIQKKNLDRLIAGSGPPERN